MTCPSRYPGSATLAGRPIRCELPAGHPGQHGHSFAARYWPNDDGNRHGWRDDHKPRTYANPCGMQTGTRYRVLCSDGRIRTATATAEADSFWTIPARVTVRGQTVTGSVSQRPDYDLPYPERPSPLYSFAENAYGRAYARRGRVLPEWTAER